MQPPGLIFFPGVSGEQAVHAVSFSAFFGALLTGGMSNSSGWNDVSEATYDGVFLDITVSAWTGGLWFKPDGSKLYVNGPTNSYQYTLSTPWDLSTAALTGSFSVTSQQSYPLAICLSADGAAMYVIGSSDMIFQYSLSIPWDITSCSYNSEYLDISGQEGNSRAMTFSHDGYHAYVIGSDNGVIYQYDMTIPWNVTTASYNSKYYDLDLASGFPVGLYLDESGTRFYAYCYNPNYVRQYTLSTPNDISTLGDDGIFKDVSSQDTGFSGGIFFKDDGSKMYVLGGGNDIVYQYSLQAG